MKIVYWLASLLLMSGIALPLGGSAPVSAQDTGEVPAYAIACDAFVTMENSAKGEGIPSDCRALEGITISAFERDGSPLAKCVTSADGVCLLNMSPNGTRIYVEDLDGVPDGYRPVQRAQRLFTYSEFAEVHFENYLDDVIPAPEADVAVISVVSRVCPDRYAGDDFAADCGEQTSGLNEYMFANEVWNTTGRDGKVRLESIPVGDVAITGGQSDATGDVYFACSGGSDPSDVRDVSVTLTAELDNVTRDFAGHVELQAGDNLACVWYQIPNLDRGMWSTLNNTMATGDREGTWIDETGNISLFVVQCANGYVASSIEDAATNCVDAPEPFAVLVTDPDSGILASGGLDADGRVMLNLSSKPISEFVIAATERTDVSADTIGCYANEDDGSGNVTDPMQQSVELLDGGWTVPGFGDDVRGVVCIWYLAGA